MPYISKGEAYMATTKKTVTKETTAEVKTAPVKAEEIKAASAGEEKKAAVKETAAAVKEEKAAPKRATRTKTAAKKPAVKKAVKEEVKVSMNVQFGGKSYTTDDLVRIAKDVWKYDLKQKAVDFKSVELYVKPEDGMAYYVINGKEAGSFYI